MPKQRFEILSTPRCLRLRLFRQEMAVKCTRILLFLAVMLILAPPLPVQAQQAAGPVVEDLFGRRVNEHGLILVDWEGYIANPAIEFFIVPPQSATFPARAVLAATEPRLYFNRPSQAGGQ